MRVLSHDGQFERPTDRPTQICGAGVAFAIFGCFCFFCVITTDTARQPALAGVVDRASPPAVVKVAAKNRWRLDYGTALPLRQKSDGRDGGGGPVDR